MKESKKTKVFRPKEIDIEKVKTVLFSIPKFVKQFRHAMTFIPVHFNVIKLKKQHK